MHTHTCLLLWQKKEAKLTLSAAPARANTHTTYTRARAGKSQHQGYGALLMAEAERIARYEHRSRKLAVISGVGTRHYYRKLGYELEGTYMVKALEPAPSRRRRRHVRQAKA